VYVVPGDSGELGVNVAVFVAGLYATVPATAVLVAVTRRANVVPVIVVGSIASLNVALTVVVVDTFVARFAGTDETMVGGVVSPVLKLNTKSGPITFPAGSRILPETVTV
jgi:hypothetical protein